MTSLFGYIIGATILIVGIVAVIVIVVQAKRKVVVSITFNDIYNKRNFKKIQIASNNAGKNNSPFLSHLNTCQVLEHGQKNMTGMCCKSLSKVETFDEKPRW